MSRTARRKFEGFCFLKKRAEMIEIWKDVVGYEDFYQVSSLGNVKNKKTQNLLKPSIDNRGYLVLNLIKDYTRKTKRVHQLVAIAFLNHKPCGMKLVVDHINNIKTDNRLENLQLITNRENCSKDIKNKSSKYTGVYWSKANKKWRAYYRINGVLKNLGEFTDELEASNAYQNKIKEITL